MNSRSNHHSNVKAIIRKDKILKINLADGGGRGNWYSLKSFGYSERIFVRHFNLRCERVQHFAKPASKTI